MVRELLGEKDNRRLKLVETIYLNPWIAMTDLSNKLGITPMQVQLDIGFFNTSIKGVQINTTKDKTCFLEIPSTLSTKVIYQTFLENNINFKLLEAILFKEYDNYEKLAEDLFISQATLKRTISFINQCFAPHEIKIISRPIRIVGNEVNIRAFYLFYLLEKYPNDDYPFPLIVKTFAKELMELFIAKFPKERFKYARKRRLERYVSVSLVRELKHHQGEDATKVLSQDLFELVLNDLDSYTNKNKFERVFHLKLSPVLYASLFSRYINDNHALSLRDYQERISQNKENKEIYTRLNAIIESVSEQLKIPLVNKEELLLKLYNVMIIGKKMTLTPYVIYPNRKIFLLFSRSIRESVLRQAKELFEKNLPMIATKNEAYFYEFLYMMVTHWEGLYQKIIQEVNPCKIGLFFNSEIEHMIYMKSDLEFAFGKKVVVELIEIDELFELKEASKNCDLLILNFILPQHTHLEIPYISVTDVMWQDKLTEINRMVDKVYYRNMQKNATS